MRSNVCGRALGHLLCPDLWLSCSGSSIHVRMNTPPLAPNQLSTDQLVTPSNSATAMGPWGTQTKSLISCPMVVSVKFGGVPTLSRKLVSAPLTKVRSWELKFGPLILFPRPGPSRVSVLDVVPSGEEACVGFRSVNFQAHCQPLPHLRTHSAVSSCSLRSRVCPR